MSQSKLSGGLVHELPKDLAKALMAKGEIIGLWENITPIARNEFICWIENGKHVETRLKRINQAVEELLDGQKRPCCWPGCIHRTDKRPSQSQQSMMSSNDGQIQR